MATVSIILNTHKTYADKTHPIMVRIAHEKKRKLIKIPGDGFNVKENQWDSSANLLKTNKKLNPDFMDQNFAIMKFYQLIQDCIKEWDDNHVPWSFDMLEERLKRKPQSVLFNEALRLFIDTHDHGPTVTVLNTQMNDFRRYSGAKWDKLTCSDINYKWVTGYMQYWRDKENSEHTLKLRLKTLAATLNYAIGEGIASKETYPFSKNENKQHVSIKSIKTTKTHRTIPEKYIHDFINFPCFYRDYNTVWKMRIFSVLTDAPFTSMIFMKNSDIKMYKDEYKTLRQGIRFYNRRHKREETIFLTPECFKIIAFMKEHCDLYDDYLFPIVQSELSSEKEISAFIDIQRRKHTRSFNLALKRLPYDIDTLTKENLKENKDLMNFTFIHPEQMYAKQLFLFSHYCQGMNLIDMGHLKYSDIMMKYDVNGNSYQYFSYYRSKTGNPIEVMVLNQIQNIINFFEERPDMYPRVDNYILPIARRNYKPSDQEIYNDVKLTGIAMNAQLKKIAKLLNWDKEIAEKFSFYFGRHTYAQRVLIAGASNALIQKALGHKNIETTENYLEGFDVEQIAAFNASVFDANAKVG